MATKKTIRRVPVTSTSFSKTASAHPQETSTRGQGAIGQQVKATTGAMNVGRMRAANTFSSSVPWFTGMAQPSAYRSAYGQSGNSAGAFGDVPLYFVLMNENNGGILYWPVNLKEKYEWYRYFYRTDPYVGGAIDLHVELPLSRIMLNMPRMKDQKKRDKILKKYENMCKKTKLLQKLQSVLFEYLIIGNVFIFFEWDESKKEWERMVILPPEEVNVFRYPFSDHSRVEYRPERLMAVLKRMKDQGFTTAASVDDFLEGLEDDEKKVLKHIPRSILDHIVENDAIVMDTDPYSADDGQVVGSYVHHLARHRPEYLDLGVSLLERVLVPLLMKEHYKYTQLSLASRNMTPRNKVSAEGVPEAELDNLREQIDLSMLDPDYSIVTNYPWDWEQIGADARLMDLSREYEVIEAQLFAGLGATRELLTGEGMYSGGKITVEILNTRYMIMRDVLIDMVEENLFKPMADANGHYDEDEDGNRTYYYPHLTFSRLTIRDNQEVFDSLFQLYQKGSLPIDVIFELFNLDSDRLHEQLQKDMFTVKDAVFNDMMRSVYSDVGTQIVENSDLASKIIGNLTGPDGKPLTMTGQGEDEGDSGFGDFGGFKGNLSSDDRAPRYRPESEQEEETPAEEQSTEPEKKTIVDQFVSDVVGDLDSDTSSEGIKELVKKKLSEE